MHVAVIGGGIIGTLSAYYLDQAGHSVTLIEQNSSIASAASGMNGGQLSYAYVSPLGNPGVYELAARAAFGGLEDVKITKWIDAQFWHWGARLLLCEASQERYKYNQSKLLALTTDSRKLMNDYLARHSVDFHHSTAGKMHLYVSDSQIQSARKLAPELAKHGFPQRFLTPRECLALEPSLAERKGDLLGAMISDADESGDCALFAQAVIAQLNGKINLRSNTHVSKIIFKNGRASGVLTHDGTAIAADAVLVCAGAQSYHLLRGAGVTLPLYPIKGYSTEFSQQGINLRHYVTDHLRRVVFTPMGDHIRVAGLMHFSGMDDSISTATRAHLTRVITDVFPQADVSNLAFKAGFRPYLPTSRPLTGATKRAGLFVNVGHAMLGWTLAHATCKHAADALGATG